MRTLVRFAWRELWASKWKFAVLALILTAQTAALAGGSIAFDSLFYTRDHYYEALRFADLRFQIRAVTADEMPALERLAELPSVTGVSRRFDAFAYTELAAEQRPLPVVVHYIDPAQHPKVDDLHIVQGTFLNADDADGAVIERSFAQAHGLTLGDRFVVDPHNFPVEFRVIGIGLSPEYLMPTANPEVLIPNRGSLGVVFASTRKLDALFAQPLYNEVSFRLRPGADRATAARAITAALHGVHIERSMPLESNFGYRYVENILGGSRIFMPMTALLLAAMAAIVAMVIVARLIADRRKEIGALMAQGFSRANFVSALLLLGIAPALAACVAGIPSAMLFGKGLAETNASIAGLPPPIMIYPAARLASACATAMAVGVISVLLASTLLLRGGPWQMLRATGVTTRTPGRLGSLIAGVFSSIAARYACRNVTRRLGLSVSAITLVGLAIAMPAGLITAMASWDIWAHDTAAALGWDAAVSFKSALTDSEARSLLDIDGVGTAEPWLQGYATLTSRHMPAREMRVVGLPVPAALYPLEPTHGRSFHDNEAREIVFNTSFLRGQVPPALGDVVELSFDGRTERLTVVGWVSDASIATVFVPVATAQRLFDQPHQFSGAYVAFDGSPHEAGLAEQNALHERLERALLAREMVGSVQLKLGLERAMIVYLRGFNAVVIPFIFLAGLLGFLFLLGVLNLVMAERSVEYATLRSMGYASREISGIIMIELAVLVGAGLCASVLAWFQLALMLRDLMARAWFWIPISLRASDYTLVVIPVVLFLFAAAVPAIRQLLRADPSLVLRERALG